MTYLIVIVLHIAGLILGFRIINHRTPKRWNTGDTKETALNGNHRVHWIPMDQA